MDFPPVRSRLQASPHQRAEGRLDIALAALDGRTRLSRFYQQGCLKARCLPALGGPEVVSLNISGGIAGGDALETRLEIGAGGKAVFTTQAAERVYRSLDEAARVKTSLFVGQDAHLAYLPQETILFNGFALDRTLEIDLAAGASFIGVESLVFGRLAMGEVLNNGFLLDRINLRRQGHLIWRDVAKVGGDVSARLDWPGVGGQARAVASLVAVGPDAAARLTRLSRALDGYVAGVSQHGDIVLLRLLAGEAATLRRAVEAALTVLRDGALPRVWQS
ncbi:MAG TPA: urease accessory protein UreD [Acidocella sp.]|nr:urease accessory protein UreD [Acidocella sp.]